MPPDQFIAVLAHPRNPGLRRGQPCDNHQHSRSRCRLAACLGIRSRKHDRAIPHSWPQYASASTMVSTRTVLLGSVGSVGSLAPAFGSCWIDSRTANWHHRCRSRDQAPGALNSAADLQRKSPIEAHQAFALPSNLKHCCCDLHHCWSRALQVGSRLSARRWSLLRLKRLAQPSNPRVVRPKRRPVAPWPKEDQT